MGRTRFCTTRYSAISVHCRVEQPVLAAVRQLLRAGAAIPSRSISLWYVGHRPFDYIFEKQRKLMEERGRQISQRAALRLKRIWALSATTAVGEREISTPSRTSSHMHYS
jgi:hypothetical protein